MATEVNKKRTVGEGAPDSPPKPGGWLAKLHNDVHTKTGGLMRERELKKERRRAQEVLLTHNDPVEVRIQFLNEIQRKGFLEELGETVMSDAFKRLVCDGLSTPERNIKDALQFYGTLRALARHSMMRTFVRQIVPGINQPNAKPLPFAAYKELAFRKCPFTVDQEVLIIRWADIEERGAGRHRESVSVYLQARKMFPRGVKRYDQEMTWLNNRNQAFLNPS